jgi:SAM-dependent methyltransferase
VQGRNEQDALNQRTWSKSSSTKYFEKNTGFVHEGERIGFEYVRERLRGRPVLEIGVGTGRTIDFTAPLSPDYRAIDYLPAMVEAARKNHPGVKIDLGDARTLDGLPTGHFGLVTFSFAGIDAVSHGDRPQVFRAVRRVLADDGMFFFSTLNLDGPEFRERPWHVPLKRSKNPVRLAVNALRAARWATKDLVRWARARRMGDSGPGWAVAPLSAHGFGIVAHYTTLAHQLDELADTGFDRSALVWDGGTGKPITAGDDTSGMTTFHLVAVPKRP